jgi:hypothetical protein
MNRFLSSDLNKERLVKFIPDRDTSLIAASAVALACEQVLEFKLVTN